MQVMEEESMLCDGKTFNSCAVSRHDKFAWNLGASSKIYEPNWFFFFFFKFFCGFMLQQLPNLNAIFYVFYVLLTMNPCIIFFKWSQLGAHYFLVYLFELLYMFRATTWSSGELTVCMQHWYFSLCMGGWLVCCSRPDSHPYRVKNTGVAQIQ